MPLTNRTKIGLFIVLALIIGLGVTAFLLYDQYQEFLGEDLWLPNEGQVVMVEPGDSLTSVIRALEAAGATEMDWRWRILARRNPVTVHVGEYLFKPPMRPAVVLEMVGSGRVLQHRFTLVEGWSWSQLLRALRDDPVLEQTVPEALHAAEIDVIADEIGASDIAHAEGWFLPETYYFVRGERDVDVLARAHAAMRSAVDDAWAARSIGLPLETPYELLILASIVEKETSLESERAQIAGVLTRRLQKGMRLQVDPTVIYGLGEAFDGDIRRRDLQADNPYNTYTRNGLPPTPIAMPGRVTLNATANPADGDALYFVADGKGGHTFSATLEEHEAAVQELIRRERQ